MNFDSFTKYLDSDYEPIPYTNHIWLPKDFNDSKYLTAYVRKATRNKVRIMKDGNLDLEAIYKGDIKPNFYRTKDLDFSDLKGKTRANLSKVMRSTLKGKNVEYVSPEIASTNKTLIKSRKTIFKLNHYAWLFQNALIKHEYNGVFPSSNEETALIN